MRPCAARITRVDVRSVSKPAIARPPPDRQTARTGRLNFPYTGVKELRKRVAEWLGDWRSAPR
jgi:hypothetical protein